MNNIKFKKLSPEIMSDIEGYKEALDYVFSEQDILNIAITGPFGAGKSSIIESYKLIHQEKNIINISLAAFNRDEINEDKKSNKSSDESPAALENKIINQLIHQINLKTIPLSNYKVKRSLSGFQHALKTTCTMFLLIYPIFILNLKLIEKYINSSSYSFLKKFFSFFCSADLNLLLILVYTIIIGYFVNSLFKFQIGRMLIKKLKIQGYEIELHENSDATHFDKYLDEIMYIFENAHIDSIIFEDIDRRSESVELFSKLRELNYTINKKGKRVKFLYLVRDDIFNSKDRTKFFDFILPIIPIVDSSNSCDMIIEVFKSSNIVDDFDKKYLQDMSFYIDDMRLIKNIHNEYVIYRKRLSLTEKVYDKLLSIIVFKNMFPEDFIKLQVNQGFMFSIFSSKSILIRTEENKLNASIDRLRKELLLLDKELIKDIDELDAIYLNFGELIINGEDTIKLSSRKELISEIKQTTNTVYTKSTSSIISIDEKLKELNDNEEYVQRKKIVTRNNENVKSQLKQEIEDLQSKLENIRHSKISELLSRDNIDEYIEEISKNVGLEYSEKITKNHYFPLIIYITRNGFIDESYANYLTYFYESSLCLSDKNFILSILNKRSKPCTYKLDNVEVIVDKLNSAYFDNEEVLNYQLLDYILKNKKEYSKRVIEQLKKNKNIEFYYQYFKNTKLKLLLVSDTADAWVELLHDISVSNKLAESDKKEIFDFILQNAENDVLKRLNYEGCLNLYISNMESLSSIEKSTIKNVLNNVSYLNAKFSQMNLDSLESSTVFSIFELSIYEINSHMISSIFKYVLKGLYVDKYENNMYTILNTSDFDCFKEYINNNIFSFMEVYLKLSEGLITDSVDMALEILNNEAISISQKEIYIKYYKNMLISIESIDQVLWGTLIEYQCILPTAKNIIEYFLKIKNEFDEIFIEYLNTVGIEEDTFDNIWNDYSMNESKYFLYSLIYANNVKDTIVLEIIKTYKYKLKVELSESINQSRIRALIKSGFIGFTDKNEMYLREHLRDLLDSYIIQNISDYIESHENSIPEDDIYILLSSEEISTDYKLEILDNYDDEISIAKHNFNTEIMERILNHHFISEEVVFLIRLYNQYNARLQNEMLSKLCTNISKILKSDIEIPVLVLLDILGSDLININTKSDIILHQFNYKNIGELIKVFTKANYDNFAKLLSGGRPQIEIGYYPTLFMKELKKKGFLLSFTEDKQGYFYKFRVNSRFKNL